MKKLLLIILSMQFLFATDIHELNSGDIINGSILEQEKQYYKIVVSQNKSLHVRLTNLKAGMNLYIKRKEKPRIRSNDCYSSNSKLKNEECILNNTEASTEYYILVYGFKAGTYVLGVDIEELETLSKEGVKGEASKGSFKNYKLSVKKGENVKVKLFDLTRDTDLRVKIGRKANRHTFDCKSINGETKEDSCSVILKNDAGVSIQVDGTYALELVNTETHSFPKNVLLNANENPEEGVYVKYTKDKKKAYIFVDQESRYFDKHKGLTAVDISNKEHPIITMHSRTVYVEPSDFYITENGNILLFTYTNTHQYMATLNLSTLELVESVMITISGVNSWANLYKTNTNVDLFYTVHETPEQGRHTYYHVSTNGDISKISGIDSGALDSHFIWEQGSIGEDKYYITYLDEYASGLIQYLKYTKKIYDVSNLPDMPLIDTIITEEEIAI